MIEIYTDGACLNNPKGPGGWAAIVIEDRRRTAYSGGPIQGTTNQRMEVQAAIEGLSRTAPGSLVTVYSDSEYLVNTMTKGWKRRVNLDLWAKLDALVAERQAGFQWVKGHDGHPVQEEADRLATSRAAGRGAANPDASGSLGSSEHASPADAARGSHRPHPTPTGRGSAAAGAGRPALSHVDEQGRARMVDISAKADSERVAIAKGRVVMAPETLALIRSGKTAKGDVLAVARVAGVMGAKRTPDLIPLCHPLLLTGIAVDFAFDEAQSAIEITATVRTTGKTGVEMEAMTAVLVSALTIYDMAKAADRRMRIEAVRLVRKSGGKSGEIVLE